ncbi:diphthine--ammonia ligase [Thermococci archaeon]|nr:MAG: diphthine--ammonia ligase [Thermococci archaeon]
MRLGVLFSGGKDSCFACYKAMKKYDVVCLISIISRNEESYMFHTPNIALTKIQAEIMNIPLIIQETEGKKEEELKDLKKAIEIGKEKYKIEGVVTGAIESVYQSSRIQKICNDLDIGCFNPIWQMNQMNLLRELVSAGFKTVITGVFAYPFDETWLGREIDEKTIKELEELQKRHKISPSGEGGEIETFVYDAPMFKKRIEITKASKTYSKYSGVYRIEEVRLVEK